MKFIYQDLLNFLTHQPSKEDLSKKLFQLGHEHEIIGDIFDMEITPNRGDCLSLIGLSRDLNNFYDSKDPFEIYDEEIESLDINFTNLSTESCPKISFLEIPEDCKSAVHLGIIKLNTDDPEEHKKIFKNMRMKNIGVQLHYIPIHTHPFYKKLGFKYGDFPQSEIYAKKAMSLPLFPGLKKRNQIKVINYLKDLIK